MNEAEIICGECVHYEKDCPLHGMTDGIDEPLEGSMMWCIHCELDPELLGDRS